MSGTDHYGHLKSEEAKLVNHFCEVDVYEGQRGDLDAASPADSAIRVMNERREKIKTLKLAKDALLKELKYALAFVAVMTCEHANASEGGRLNAEKCVERIQALIAKAKGENS